MLTHIICHEKETETLLLNASWSGGLKKSFGSGPEGSWFWDDLLGSKGWRGVGREISFMGAWASLWHP